ncbi:MAG TPA: YidB family protein, partial [Accumulibacter sp.]|uniref:YidB family protein n=1 Tax=Accumulibacter sp. TaxID=2053492 RepID=UPI002C39E323
MGLLDSVLGSVLGGQQTAQAGQSGGLGGLLAMLLNNPQLLQVAASLLGNDGQHGGLGGLAGRFQQAGLGDVMASWIGTGENQPVSGAQIGEVLGQDTLSGLAQQLGVNESDAAGQLASILPGLIDHLTPGGQAPQGGLG